MATATSATLSINRREDAKMVTGSKLSGPMDGHWMTSLYLIESDDSGKAFICQICVRGADGNRDRARFRSAHNASNLYSHFKHVHSEVYSILEPLIQAKINNKRQRNNNAQQVLKLRTVKTLNSRQWSKSNNVIETVKNNAQSADFLTFMFDGWSTARAEAVLGCMVSTIDANFLLETKTVGNFRLAGRHTAADICNVLKSVIQKRLGGRKPTYFVSDSAPANKASVRMLMQNDGGDDHWYPCAVHFCQLVMKEAVTTFLAGEKDSTGPTGDVDAIDWDELDDEGLIHQVDMLSTTSAYKRLTHTARAIRATLRRSHRRMQTFTTLQNAVGIFRTISSDVPTRFDSTIEMFESVLVNKPVLLRLQEQGRRDGDVWPLALHLTADDFELIKHVVNVLDPVRAARKDLSSATATVADVVPTFTWEIDSVNSTEVLSTAKDLKKALVNALVLRLKMLLGAEEALPSMGGRKYTTIFPNEYIVSSYLSPRYHQAMRSCHGYSERSIVTEMSSILQDCASEDQDQSEHEQEQECTSGLESLSAETGVQSWIDHVSTGRESSSSRRDVRKPTMRNEYVQFCSEVCQGTYSGSQSRAFWVRAHKRKTFPRLSLLARMFLAVPASAIPQERHFSELKRRCGALRTKTKIETLDRDAAVYSWIDESSR